MNLHLQICLVLNSKGNIENMKQKSLIRWMVITDFDMYYCEAGIGYPFGWFTKDWTDAYFFEKLEDAEGKISSLENTDLVMRVVKVRVILQHLEEY